VSISVFQPQALHFYAVHTNRSARFFYIESGDL
jgi:hypothetical protein